MVPGLDISVSRSEFGSFMERSLDNDLMWWVHFQIVLQFTVWVYWDAFWITLLMINTVHFLRITR